MRAMVMREGGELRLAEVESPTPGISQVRVRVRATAVNRADLVQRAGKYPAPPLVPADILGLEYAGEIDALGPGVQGLALGQRVYGLVGGGSYAEHVVVHERAVAPMPANLSFEEAAAIPEAFLTAYDAMVLQAGLRAGEWVLVHAAASGVGTAALQIAKAVGARAIATVRSADKRARLLELGAEIALCVPDGAFAAPVLAAVPAGVEVVLELVGGGYLAEDLRAVALGGRIVLVGLVGGRNVDLDLGRLLTRRISVRGTVMRSRPIEEQIVVHQVLARQITPLIERGALSPVIDRVYELTEVEAAHQHMSDNLGFGKLVLRV